MEGIFLFKKFLLNVCLIFFIGLLYIINTFPVFFEFSKKLEVYKNKSNGAILFLTNIQSVFVDRKGESFCVDKNFNLEQFLNYFNADIVFQENIEQGTSYFAYSSKIRYCEFIKNKKINLHIFVAENYIKVGAPIIYGGF